MARKVIERNISFDDVRKIYYVTFNYGKDASGSRKKTVKTYSTPKEARQALAIFEADKASGSIVAPSEMSVKGWLDYWMENIIKPNREETTVYGYANIIKNHLVPAFGELPIQKLNAKKIQEYYSKKMSESGNPKLSSNTVRKHHELLKAALKCAVMQGAILKNPCDLVEPPKTIDPEKSYYDPATLSKLFVLAEGNRLEIPIKLAGYLGLRREEICGLRWENIDFENRLITIKNAVTAAGKKIIKKGTKTKKSIRTMYIPADLYSALQKEKDKQEKYEKEINGSYSGYVLQKPNGALYRPNYVSEMFTRFLEANGMPRIVLHELRHTFASIANSIGISMFDIGKALGHSTPSTTGKVYTHLLDGTNKEAISRIAESIENASVDKKE